MYWLVLSSPPGFVAFVFSPIIHGVWLKQGCEEHGIFFFFFRHSEGKNVRMHAHISDRPMHSANESMRIWNQWNAFSQCDLQGTELLMRCPCP